MLGFSCTLHTENDHDNIQRFVDRWTLGTSEKEEMVLGWDGHGGRARPLSNQKRLVSQVFTVCRSANVKALSSTLSPIHS